MCLACHLGWLFAPLAGIITGTLGKSSKFKAGNRRYYGLCEVPIIVGFCLFLCPPVPKTNQPPKTQDPKSDQDAHIFFLGGKRFAFLGFRTEHNYVGQDNPELPRANEHMA